MTDNTAIQETDEMRQQWAKHIEQGAPKREWVGLTDDEGTAIANWQLAGNHPLRAVIQAIETKLKEKNGG
jgi:hypothetical protein